MNKNLKIVLAVLGSLLVLFFVFYLLDPMKSFATMRNNERQAELTAIADAITKYAGDNSGTLPRGIKVSDSCKEDSNRICKTGIGNCDQTDLSILTKDGKYIKSLPVDPSASSGNYTGYNIVQSKEGRITLCAPKAENGSEIVVKK